MEIGLYMSDITLTPVVVDNIEYLLGDWKGTILYNE